MNSHNLSAEQRESLALAISYMETALELLDSPQNDSPQNNEGADATRAAQARLVLLQAQARVYEVCNGGKAE